MRGASPLRYPGGKWRIAPFLRRVIEINHLDDPIYIEPYAGGASLALSLLFDGLVAEIHLNDLDFAVYAFWRSVLTNTRELLKLISEVSVTPDEWYKQKAIYAEGTRSGTLALGFAKFFLNRTSHSGILNGGMIGGKEQMGKWKLDARFNRAELARRISRISSAKNHIFITSRDALDVLKDCRSSRKRLVYLDPPYYRPGRHLYLNDYKPNDHFAVRKCVEKLVCPWIVSYDDVNEIRKLYKGVHCKHLALLHTASRAHLGAEILYFSPELRIPKSI
ncbi:MAG: DNA adenine methylase [Candidatus Binataceae bacterium]